MALQYKSTEVYLKPDVRFKSTLVAKFINNLMKKGISLKCLKLY